MDWVIPTAIWTDAMATFVLPTTKSYDVSDGFATTPVFGVNPEITTLRFPKNAGDPRLKWLLDQVMGKLESPGEFWVL